MPGPTHLNPLVFRSVRVTPITMKSIKVEWALEPTSASLVGLTFTVEQSGGKDGPWDVLTTGLASPFWLDTTANLRNKHRLYFYRVTAIKAPNADVISAPATWKDSMDRVGVSIADRLSLILRNAKKGIGIPFTHYPVRTWGQKCPDCFDVSKQRLKQSNCITCFGTNWVGGFWGPGIAWGSIQTRPALTQLGFQEINPAEAGILCSNYPTFHVRDILIDKDSAIRWRVIRIDSTSKRDNTIHQLLRVTHVIPEDVEYRLAPL